MLTLANGVEAFVKELLNSNHHFRLNKGEARMRSLTKFEVESLAHQGFGGDAATLIETLTERVDEELHSFVVNIMKNTLAGFSPDDIADDVFCRNYGHLSDEVEDFGTKG